MKRTLVKLAVVVALTGGSVVVPAVVASAHPEPPCPIGYERLEHHGPCLPETTH